MKKFIAKAIALLSLATICLAAAAQTYPSRAIRLIIPYSPGGVTDQFGRVFADIAGKKLGQQIFIENRAGANGTLGAVQMLSTDPAGYSITMIPIGVFRMPHITGTQYDPLKDLTYLGSVVGFNYYIVVNSSSPWKSIAELIDYSKRNAGPISYGSPGAFSSQHIAMAQLSELAGVDWTHVPYKGDSDAMAALLGNHIQAIVSASTVLPYVGSGKMRVLASLGEKRTAELPDAPTLKELGYPVVHTSPVGFAGPKGMDPAVAKKLETVIADTYNDPDFQSAIKKLGLTPEYMAAAEYTEYARHIFIGERESLKKLAATVK